MGQADDVEFAGGGYRVDCDAEGLVHGDQDDPQLVGGHHHRVVRGAGQVGEHLGVPGVRDAGQAECFLVDRRGHQGPYLACQGELDTAADVLEGRRARAGVECAPGQVDRKAVLGEDVHRAGCERRLVD